MRTELKVGELTSQQLNAIIDAPWELEPVPDTASVLVASLGEQQKRLFKALEEQRVVCPVTFLTEGGQEKKYLLCVPATININAERKAAGIWRELEKKLIPEFSQMAQAIAELPWMPSLSGPLANSSDTAFTLFEADLNDPQKKFVESHLDKFILSTTKIFDGTVATTYVLRDIDPRLKDEVGKKVDERLSEHLKILTSESWNYNSDGTLVLHLPDRESENPQIKWVCDLRELSPDTSDPVNLVFFPPNKNLEVSGGNTKQKQTIFAVLMTSAIRQFSQDLEVLSTAVPRWDAHVGFLYQQGKLSDEQSLVFERLQRGGWVLRPLLEGMEATLTPRLLEILSEKEPKSEKLTINCAIQSFVEKLTAPVMRNLLNNSSNVTPAGIMDSIWKAKPNYLSTSLNGKKYELSAHKWSDSVLYWHFHKKNEARIEEFCLAHTQQIRELPWYVKFTVGKEQGSLQFDIFAPAQEVLVEALIEDNLITELYQGAPVYCSDTLLERPMGHAVLSPVLERTTTEFISFIAELPWKYDFKNSKLEISSDPLTESQRKFLIQQADRGHVEFNPLEKTFSVLNPTDRRLPDYVKQSIAKKYSAAHENKWNELAINEAIVSMPWEYGTTLKSLALATNTLEDATRVILSEYFLCLLEDKDAVDSQLGALTSGGGLTDFTGTPVDGIFRKLFDAVRTRASSRLKVRCDTVAELPWASNAYGDWVLSSRSCTTTEYKLAKSLPREVFQERDAKLPFSSVTQMIVTQDAEDLCLYESIRMAKLPMIESTLPQRQISIPESTA